MGEFTKGPWHVGSRIDSQETRICTIVGGDAIHGSDSAVNEWRSDANLIAAAPDLLQALETLKCEIILSDVDMDYIASHFQPHLDRAAAAIAKARGVQ